jgi:energy-coupling factor transport system permease protein
MHERLSFFVQRDSVLHRLNPLTKVTLVLGLILISFISPFYWTATLLLVLVILPLSFASGVLRQYFNAAVRLIIPAAGFLFIMQALFQPIPGRELFRFWFLHPTLESVYFAFGNAARIVLMVSSFTLLLLTTHPSELMSDLTRRGLPPQFAYVIVSTLQILPQMQAKALTIIAAQHSRGLDTESSFVKRAGSLLPLVGPLIFGSLVEVEERAIAIEARGFTSSRRKTFLREIPDRRFDRFARIVIVLAVLATTVYRLWPS